MEMDFGTHNFFCQFSSVSLEIFCSHVLYTQRALETGLIAFLSEVITNESSVLFIVYFCYVCSKLFDFGY